jgi:hypothetical protein
LLGKPEAHITPSPHLFNPSNWRGGDWEETEKKSEMLVIKVVAISLCARVLGLGMICQGKIVRMSASINQIIYREDHFMQSVSKNSFLKVRSGH